jgi:cysteine desulfuration protein SufE
MTASTAAPTAASAAPPAIDDEIAAAEREIAADFSLFSAWDERYQYIMDLGRKLPPFPEAWRTEANRIRGCQAQVWMVAWRKDGRLYFHGVSDSAIVSGLIALLIRVYSGRRPEAILAAPAKLLATVDLAGHLSPSRGNGLAAMMREIRAFAERALAQADTPDAPPLPAAPPAADAPRAIPAAD